MQLLVNAHRILADTEQALRELIERALAAGEYSEVAQIARIADGVAHLRGSDGRNGALVTHKESDRGSTLASQRRAGVSSRPTSKSSTGRRPKATEFPRFERDQDKLIKIGWSKRDRRVYEHRTPREVVVLVGTAISTQAELNEPFTMEQILPLTKDDGVEVPSYQAYLVLAWLRSVGLVRRKGREGYALADGPLSGTRLRRLWDSVPERQ